MRATIYSLVFVFSTTILIGQNTPRLYQKSTPSIVKISTLDNGGLASSGTGFFIDEHTIVTCYHVVQDINNIEIQTIDGKKFTVDSVIASNKQTDLIKFTVIEKNKTWLTLSDKLPIVGETVFLIGNPNGYDFSISSGLISAIRQRQNEQIIQTTAAASPGSSGGPLLNKKGKVVGIISYVKFAGQNLNFAATAINAINIVNDKSIIKLTSFSNALTETQLDSILNLATAYLKTKDYTKILKLILPVSNWADSPHSIAFTELIANCYFFEKDFSKAVQYFELLNDKLHSTIPKTSQMVLIYTQALHKTAMCHFMLGDKEGAVDIIKQAEEVAKSGYNNDIDRNEIYQLQLQQIYSSNALFQYSLDNKSEACLSWKLAKQYGYKTDDYNFDSICK